MCLQSNLLHIARKILPHCSLHVKYRMTTFPVFIAGHKSFSQFNDVILFPHVNCISFFKKSAVDSRAIKGVKVFIIEYRKDI